MLITGCFILAMVVACGCVSGPVEETSSTNGGGTGSLAPGPTQTLPSERSIDIQINDKDALDATIPVIFAGGKGQAAVTSIEVRVTRPDGVIITENLPAEKGAELKIQGTKGDDRVEVFVSFNDGTSYKIIDRLLPYRTRG